MEKINWKTEWKNLLWIVAILIGCFFLPVGQPRFDNAILEAFQLVKWYAREHVLLCLVPAFLYSGPAINVLDIFLTASVLGPEMGLARGFGAVAFSIIIGLLMAFFFRKEDNQKSAVKMALPEEPMARTLGPNALYFFSMVAILVFGNWGKPQKPDDIWAAIYGAKWWVTSRFGFLFGLILVRWFNMRIWKIVLTAVAVTLAAVIFPNYPEVAFAVGFIGLAIFTSLEKGETGQWFVTSWDFAKQILPRLLAGVLIAGAFLGRVGHEGLIPSEWVAGTEKEYCGLL